MTDLELIRETRAQNDQAFEEIVRRYSSLVYASALRRLDQDHALAEDITQSVFIILHRKRENLKDEIPLAGWLLKTTAFVARRALTAKFRRQRMEAEAFEQSQARAGATETPMVLPFLDDALLGLKAQEQRCISYRFFSGASFKEIAQLEQISEDAAQKRVSRALDKIRHYLERRGVGVAATSAIAGCLVESTKAASPQMVSGILSSVSGASVDKTASGGALLAKLAIAGLSRQHLLIGIAKVILLLALMIPIFVWRSVPPGSQPGTTPATGPSVAALAQQWSDVVRTMAALVQTGPPSPNTPEAADYQRRLDATIADSTRISRDLNSVLVSGDPQSILTQFFTLELATNLKLDASQQAAVSRLLSSAMSGGPNAQACLSGLLQNKATVVPKIQALLSQDQTRRFDSIYRSDGMALFSFATVAVASQQ